MSVHVTNFKWEKGKNDLHYIELLEKTLERQQDITGKMIAKLHSLVSENKQVKEQAIDEVVKQLKYSLSNNYRHLLKNDEDGFEWLTLDAVETHIDKTARLMKNQRKA